MLKPLHVISEIRNSHSEMENIFLYGSCLNLFCILRVIFPQAKAWYSQKYGHTITEIDAKFYDITGRVYKDESYYRFTQIWTRTSRAFTQMYNGEYNLNA